MINNELLQKLREPQIQAELREHGIVGASCYLGDDYRAYGIILSKHCPEPMSEPFYRVALLTGSCMGEVITCFFEVIEESVDEFILAPSTDWLWAKLMELDIIAYFNGCDTEVEINPNKIESEFTAPTLHEALLQAWLWWREHVKEV